MQLDGNDLATNDSFRGAITFTGINKIEYSQEKFAVFKTEENQFIDEVPHSPVEDFYTSFRYRFGDQLRIDNLIKQIGKNNTILQSIDSSLCRDVEVMHPNYQNDFKSDLIIIDIEYSWDIIISLVKSKKIKDRYKILTSLRTCRLQLHGTRRSALEVVKSDFFLGEYFYYFDKILVAKKQNNIFSVLKPLLFESVINLKCSSCFAEDCQLHIKYPSPKKTFNYDKKIFELEVASLDPNEQDLYHIVETNLLDGCSRAVEERLGRFLSRKPNLDQFELNCDNAQKMLFLIKLLDIAAKILYPLFRPAKHLFAEAITNQEGYNSIDFTESNSGAMSNFSIIGKSTYDLRARIFRLLPEIESYQAFTLTPHTGRQREASYWIDSKNWINERAALHAKKLVWQVDLARTLSERLKSPGIVGLRGNTAVGKTTMAIQILKDLMGSEITDPEARLLLKGSLNPDEFKQWLKEEDNVVDLKVHKEGSMLYKKLHALVTDKPLINFILDSRLKDLKTVEDNLIAHVNQNKPGRLFDFDGSLRTSLTRILTRDPYRDPCPPLSEIVSGFKILRENRAAIVQRIAEEASMKEYKLYFGTKYKLVAEKVDGKIVLHDPALFAKLTKAPPEEELRELDVLITPECIEKAIFDGDIVESARASLEKWIKEPPMTLGAAVSLHVKGDRR